jgi:hypothetical protein
MKGETMKHRASTPFGLLTAALLFAFALTAAAPAEAGGLGMKSQLAKSGIGLKIVRLDRTDGFLFGLSFTGPRGANIVLSPGLGGMLLAQVDGSDIILQRDSAGKMQVIQAEGDLELALCIVQSVITFINDLTLCQGEPTCVIATVIQLVTSIMTCNTTTVPVE